MLILLLPEQLQVSSPVYFDSSTFNTENRYLSIYQHSEIIRCDNEFNVTSFFKKKT